MTDNIKPDHYRTGEIDLYEAFSQIFPHNEYRAGMQMIAMRYMFRDKIDRVEDISKAIYTLERLKEKEVEHTKNNVKKPEEDFIDMGKSFGGMKTAGEYLEDAYRYRDNLLKRLLNEGYEYLARDESGDLFAYAIEPEKKNYLWTVYFDDCEIIENDNFPEIKWADDEPTFIADLLEIYKNGGESGKYEG